ncbi:S41 family peptidase [Massilia sp. R2A-15]|uniref:S41 family peptidase n=1 Tax=Massilia sp. R2A-15 TaxID=3064278 RepID=UPI0027328358|nr:S41 family peptidase [Massilia sp. R2A-15]WLI89343.1 S41 family peptidase [Massilia sp. R2A-15]
MNMKWVFGPVLVSVALIGMVAALPTILPMWQEYRPKPTVLIDRAVRAQAIDALVAEVHAHYVFPDKAEPIETLLRQRQRNGDYDAITSGEQLAKVLTDDMASVAHDLHIRVEFSADVLPAEFRPPAARPAADQGPFFMRWIDSLGRSMAAFGVGKTERLPSNIGYLELKGFFPPHLVGDKYAAAMDKLADTGALIIDLRRNGGGSPHSVALLASYFVDQRTRLNDIWSRDTGESTQFWTQDSLAGKRYGGQKKVAILVGPGTRSAGEDFAYTMQAMKRATVIGARTWGGAHPTAPFRLGDHFVGLIPNARSISPITHGNWEGAGVIPDIAVAPADAMAVAQDLLLRRETRNAATRVALPQT